MSGSTKQKKLDEGLKNLFSTVDPPPVAKTPPKAKRKRKTSDHPPKKQVQKLADPPQPAPTAAIAEPAPEPTPPNEPTPQAENGSGNSHNVGEKTVSAKQKKLALDELLDEEEKQLVVFKLADEYYGLSIAVVDSIIKIQGITIVPHAHPYVEGVTNLRGTVLPVVDLRTRFGLPRIDTTRDTRIMVVESDGSMVGLVVDAVTEVLRVPAKIIEPPSMFVVALDAAFITGIAKLNERLITLIDLDKIFIGQESGEKLNV